MSSEPRQVPNVQLNCQVMLLSPRTDGSLTALEWDQGHSADCSEQLPQLQVLQMYDMIAIVTQPTRHASCCPTHLESTGAEKN